MGRNFLWAGVREAERGRAEPLALKRAFMNEQRQDGCYTSREVYIEIGSTYLIHPFDVRLDN
jgi:hypothetical protein